MHATTFATGADSPLTPSRARRFLLVFLLAVLATLGGMILLPHDKFLRYEALNDHVAPNAYWIYERIHYDPTPIDVAFIGTSRTGRSVNAQRLEADLRARGIATHAANLYLFKTGRNMHYAVAKELLEHRQVKLLVLEITEQEDRKPHPDFVFLADPQDIVFAPTLINLRYLSDLARLPGRQVDLFLQTALQRLGWRRPDFVPPPYRGPDIDISHSLVTLDGREYSFDREHSRSEMEALRVKQEASLTPSVLPESLNWLEYRFPRLYVDRILDLAARHGTRVVFLYVPRYGAPESPAPYKLYTQRAGLINPGPGIQNYRFWDEETHMNWSGAKFLTDAVAEQLADGGYLGPVRAAAPTVVTAGGGSAPTASAARIPVRGSTE
jgi:hypothetical protein